MIHLDERFMDAVEAAVGDAEHNTDAEIVVVAAGRSGSYRDVAVTAGVIAAAVVMGVGLFSPWHVSEGWLVTEMAIVLLAVTWAANRWPRLLRLLTTTSRRHAQVTDAAAAAFHQEQVHATRGRTGLLIYVSALEDDVAVLPDHGVDARVPQALWNDLEWNARKLDGFLDGLASAGRVLATHLPSLDGDNPDEIPNRPRVRP